MSVPAIIYKYREISPQTETLLAKREIYFPLATEINDPFDCRIVLNREAPAETLWEMIKEHYGKKFNVSDEEDIVHHLLLESAPKGAQVTRAMVTEIIRERKWKSLANHIEAGNENLLRMRLAKTRLCSFSAVRDNLLMWSHYANYHRGICLGFKTKSTIFQHVKPVQYLSEYPKVSSYSVDDETYIQHSLFSKAKDWSYEQEWRIVLTAADRVANPIHHFAPDALAELVFGCQCKQIDRLRVEHWLSSGGISPNLYEAGPRRNEFALDITQLD